MQVLKLTNDDGAVLVPVDDIAAVSVRPADADDAGKTQVAQRSDADGYFAVKETPEQIALALAECGVLVMDVESLKPVGKRPAVLVLAPKPPQQNG